MKLNPTSELKTKNKTSFTYVMTFFNFRQFSVKTMIRFGSTILDFKFFETSPFNNQSIKCILLWFYSLRILQIRPRRRIAIIGNTHTRVSENRLHLLSSKNSGKILKQIYYKYYLFSVAKPGHKNSYIQYNYTQWSVDDERKNENAHKTQAPSVVPANSNWKINTAIATYQQTMTSTEKNHNCWLSSSKNPS